MQYLSLNMLNALIQTFYLSTQRQDVRRIILVNTLIFFNFTKIFIIMEYIAVALLVVVLIVLIRMLHLIQK